MPDFIIAFIIIVFGILFMIALFNAVYNTVDNVMGDNARRLSKESMNLDEFIYLKTKFDNKINAYNEEMNVKMLYNIEDILLNMDKTGYDTSEYWELYNNLELEEKENIEMLNKMKENLSGIGFNTSEFWNAHTSLKLEKKLSDNEKSK